MPVWNFKILPLITQNCLLFGHKAVLTSPKVTQYLLGTRETLEILKVYELRYLLLKIYPLIHNLFYNTRIAAKLKIKKNLRSNMDVQKVNHQTPATGKRGFSGPRVWPFETKTAFSFKRRHLSPQILFASVTPQFSEIIVQVAQICNMPWHEKRWLNGSITAAISFPSDKLVWQYLQDRTQNNIVASISKEWGKNKENEEKTKEKIRYYGKSRWPSLLVIPDVFNNFMILKEAKKVGLPVIGLVNSNCPIEIEYPVFAQNQTLQSIHFFCQFLAILIVKETVFFQHKRYLVQKIKQKTKKETPKLTLKKVTHNSWQQLKKPWKKPFFFRVVRPWQKRRVHRFLLGTNSSKAFDFEKPNWHRFRNQIIIFSMISLISDWKSQNSINFIFRNKKKALLETQHNLVAQSIFKKFKMSFQRLKKISKKKRPRVIIEQNLFKKENQKKYFQKSNLFPQKLYQKFQNFLGIFKIISQFITYYKVPGTKMRLIGFPHKPTNYFWWSLKQWSQDVKWQNHRWLINSTLKLQDRKRHGIRRYKHLFYRKGYKRDSDSPIRPWLSWINKNQTSVHNAFKPK